MRNGNLARSCLDCKHDAAVSQKWHAYAMHDAVKRKKKQPKSPLHELFGRRLEEEMSLQQLSDNDLGKRIDPKKPKQTTVSGFLRYAREPRLTQIEVVAKALGIRPWELLAEKPVVERERLRSSDAPVSDSRQAVHQFPVPEYRVFTRQSQTGSKPTKTTKKRVR
jgi:ribosome-binding protein aMBF1 (putative translation factor)